MTGRQTLTRAALRGRRGAGEKVCVAVTRVEARGDRGARRLLEFRGSLLVGLGVSARADKGAGWKARVM